MPHNTEISNSQPESFTQKLRRNADEYERNAPAYEGTSYPPSWWLQCAAEDRKLADEIDAIHGVRQ